MGLARLLFIILAISSSSCVTHRCGLQAGDSEKSERVWMISNGFHTSLGIEAAKAPAELRKLYPSARFLAIGWGGRSMYMAPSLLPWHILNAVLIPNNAALHVVPVYSSLKAGLSRSEIIEFQITPGGLQRLQSRLSRAFRHDPDGEIVVYGPGKIHTSHFYAGTETYMFPNTCNQWAAKGLYTAGVPIMWQAAIAADNLIWQGRRHGKLLAIKSRPLEAL